jgi:predicted Zn finger-like uncharacterized protein
LYTRCPHCLTVFVVGAEQLKAAHGNVRCGTCLESFDAIPYLSDGPLQPLPSTHSDDEHDPDVSGDARSASEQLSSTLDAARAATSEGKGAGPADESALEHPPDAPEPTSDDDDDVSESSPWDELAHTPVDEDPDRVATGGRVSVLDESEPVVDESLPAVLREDAAELAARTSARRRNIGYGSAALALLALLALQYVFFMPEDAARRYPQWRGAIESLCVQFGCVLPERRDASRIGVVSRDVRVHPRYEGVLQIKATLTNAAKFRQPYPRVRFTLFNVNGQTIATRVFQPSEYLGRSVAASARLRPQTPFQVELDVLAPEEAAVSFEFQFL